MVGLIGPNGSGKSTVFNLVTGLLRPDEGTILYDGERIDGLATHEIARRGIGRTFQSVKIFRDLPVRENLAIAAMGRAAPRLGAARAGVARPHGPRPSGRRRPRAASRSASSACSSSTMNLVIDPEFLLLDEPLAGVHPVVRRQIADDAAATCARAAARS